MPAELNESRVLLTGATGGIGNAIARSLHARGARLILTGRRTEALGELVSELGERVESWSVDLADRDAVQELAAEVGDVDVLVANAGLPGSGRLDEYSREEIDRVLDVNLGAPVHLTRALLPGMLERGHGHLVYISSMSGKVATLRASLYNGTKFGLRGFAFGLREDLRGTGVGVTTVFPGFISGAGMWADSGLKPPSGIGTRTPEQVAEAVLTGIDKDRAEIDVAPLFVRAGGWFAGAAPGVIAAITRRGGADLGDELAAAQKVKR